MNVRELYLLNITVSLNLPKNKILEKYLCILKNIRSAGQ